MVGTAHAATRCITRLVTGGAVGLTAGNGGIRGYCSGQLAGPGGQIGTYVLLRKQRESVLYGWSVRRVLPPVSRSEPLNHAFGRRGPAELEDLTVIGHDDGELGVIALLHALRQGSATWIDSLCLKEVRRWCQNSEGSLRRSAVSRATYCIPGP